MALTLTLSLTLTLALSLSLSLTRLPCRTVELAVDVLGLLRPAPRTRAVSTRGQRGVPVPLELRCATPLPPGGAARKALVTALGTHTLDDSDVYVVLRGLGGACGADGR